MMQEVRNYADGAVHLFDAEKDRNPKTKLYGDRVRLGAFVITCVAIAAVGVWMFNHRNDSGTFGIVCKAGFLCAIAILAFSILFYVKIHVFDKTIREAKKGDDGEDGSKIADEMDKAADKQKSRVDRAEAARRRDEIEEDAESDGDDDSDDVPLIDRRYQRQPAAAPSASTS